MTLLEQALVRQRSQSRANRRARHVQSIDKGKLR
jgi:hypothetical protein